MHFVVLLKVGVLIFDLQIIAFIYLLIVIYFFTIENEMLRFQIGRTNFCVYVFLLYWIL